MLELFEQYTNQFDKMNKDILLKYYHSFRVMELSKILALKENFNEKDQDLATIIGLLHDYGRFPQIRKFNTFKDIDSLDHANLGVKLLFDNNEIEPYKLNPNDYSVVKNAISNHNKLTIDPMDERSLIFSKLIRDADKIDIIYIVIDNPSNGEISLKVKEAFLNETQCCNKDIKTDNDTIIATLCFIYDINYLSAFKYIKDNLLIERLKNKINNKELDEYFDRMIVYIEKRLNNARN